MTPSPRLLQSLQRSRLLVRSAKATVGIGERRSNAKGSGMEFLDYREYQPGDDVRHLDPHLFGGLYGPIAQAVAVLFVLWLICLGMYRQKIFVKI